MTEYQDKCNILSELWLEYKTDDNLSDFFNYNDLGLPLAYAISSGIVKSTDKAEKFISETFDILLATMAIEEDEGFVSLEDIFLASNV